MVMNISHGLFHLGASLSWLLRGNVKDFNVVIFIDAGSERTGDGVVGQRSVDRPCTTSGGETGNHDDHESQTESGRAVEHQSPQLLVACWLVAVDRAARF